MNSKTSILERLKKLFFKEEGLDDLLVMSRHWDGYKRENAVRRLGMLGNPLALPELMIRANDWVLQVRVAAKNAILNLRKTDNTEAFIACLPELYHLQKCGRDNHDDLINTIERFLLLYENRESITKGISDVEPLVQRACFNLVLKNELMPLDKLVLLGLEQSDIVTRTRASHLLRNLTSDVRAKALQLALNDRFMPIRREALQIKIKKGINEEELVNCLFDSNAPIREIAIKNLKAIGVDVFKIYKESLSSNSVKKIKSSLWGFGFLGNAECSEYIRPFLTSEYASIRKQAISTCVSMLGEESIEELVEGLKDASSAVCKESTRLIKKLKIRSNSNELLEIVASSNHIHTVNSCISLAKTANKWERFIFLLDILKLESQNNEQAQFKVRNALIEWDLSFNNSLVNPNVDQVIKLRERITTIEEVFDEQGMKGILLSLKAFGVTG